MNALGLYRRYLGISVRSQMQYKASFVMLSAGHLLVTGIEFLGMWALFDRFGHIEGWSLPQVAFFYGLVNVAFALADASARGFDIFADMVKSGDFDRLLLRPRSTALQVAGQELTLRRVGRLLQGLIVLLWSAHALGLTWTAPRLLLLAAAIFSGVCVFFGVIVLQAAAAFWTTESLELFNSFSYGGVQAAQYPLTIYRAWFRRFFTAVVPLAFVSYYPVLGLLGLPDPLGAPALLPWLSPLVGPLFALLTLHVWKVGVRHYTSTGS